MEEVFKVTRLTKGTPESTQNALKKALQAVDGVQSVKLRPDTHEFAIKSEGVKRADVIKAATKAGFQVRNNTASPD